MATILLTAPYLIPFLERFRPVFEHYRLEVIVPPVEERMEEDDLLAYAGQFDGALCGDDRYSERVLQACAPRLKVISKWGTGIDSIDAAAAERLGIMVGRTLNAFTLPVADTVLGYMLAFARRGPRMDREMKVGKWEKIPGVSLSECTLGVVGVGNIGKAVLRRGGVFGMRLLGNDIIPIAPDFLAENRVQMVSLQQLVAEADFISLNTDLNPSSFHLVNAELLAGIKPGSVLINTSRGPVVDEAALVQALQQGRLGGAALYVFEIEPLPADSPLLKMDNVLLAPHNSNSSPAAWERLHWNTIRNLLIGLGLPTEDLERFV